MFGPVRGWRKLCFNMNKRKEPPSKQPGIDRFFLNPNGVMEMRNLVKQPVEVVDKYQRSQLQVLQPHMGSL